MAPRNPFEEDTQLTSMSTKSYFRPTSNLTLPAEAMYSISRSTTNVSGTPAADLETPSSHPFSAFYDHPGCVVSLEAVERKSMAKETSPTTAARNRDIEKGAAVALPPKGTLGSDLTPSPSARPSCEPSLTTTQTNGSTGKPITTFSKDGTYCTVWPAGSEVRQRKKDARRMKGCLLFRNLTRKQKIIAKVCVGVLILGLATVIGVCISYKTGGAVWKSANNYGAIGT